MYGGGIAACGANSDADRGPRARADEGHEQNERKAARGTCEQQQQNAGPLYVYARRVHIAVRAPSPRLRAAARRAPRLDRGAFLLLDQLRVPLLVRQAALGRRQRPTPRHRHD